MALNPSSGWEWVRQINISDTANVSADYQMKLKVYAGSGTDDPASGIIYCNNHCKNFPNDIRFGTTNNPSTATQLPQWIEDYETGYADIWIKLPSDGSDTIYIFAGNSGASQYSDGDATFIFFDDFEGTSLDTNKWTATGSVSVSNSEVTIQGTSTSYARITSIDTFGYDTAIRSRWKYTVTTAYFIASVGYNGPAFQGDTDWAVQRFYDYTDTYDVFSAVGGTGTAIAHTTTPSLDTYHVFDIIREGTATLKGYIDDGDEKTKTDYIPTASFPVKCCARGGASDKYGTLVVDYIFVRKYASTPPVWSSFGRWISLKKHPIHHLDKGPHPRSRMNFFPKLCL